jgi:hypothetical protein
MGQLPIQNFLHNLSLQRTKVYFPILLFFTGGIFINLYTLAGKKPNYPQTNSSLNNLKRYFRLVDSLNQKNVSFEILESPPISGDSTWRVSFSLIINNKTLDSLISQNAYRPNEINYILKQFEVQGHDWAANLLLYSYTSINAIDMEDFRPNKIENWRTKRKDIDLKFWHKYFADGK